MRHLFRAGVLALVASHAFAQGASIGVPSTIALDGVPPIPVSLAERLAPYGDFGFAEFLGWHPLRREILIATAFGPRRHVHRVEGPGRAPLQLTFGAAITGGAVYEPAKGEYFVFGRDPSGGSERPQLYRFDLATQSVTLLTDGTSRNGGNAVVWSRASGLIAFDSNRRTTADRDIWIMDPRHPADARLLLEAKGNWIAQDWSPDDRSLLVEERVSIDERYLWRVDVTSGTKTELTPRADGPAAWSSPRFGPGARTVYAISNRGGEFTRLWRLDVATSAWTPLTPAGTAVESFALAPDGRTIAVVFDREAVSVLELVDVATMKTRNRPKVPAGTIRNLFWHPGGRDLAFNLQSIHTFLDVYSLSAATGAVERWTTSESGGSKVAELPAPEIVRWRSFDGQSVTGVLYRPPPRFTGPRPVIVNIHGGPDDRERPRFLGRSAAFLNEFGVAILYPNVRGSSGFGKAFLAADNGHRREDAIKDIGALLDWIGQQPALDRTRVMVTGASYGGYLTYAVAAMYPDRIRCAFAAAAISDFVSYLEQTEPVRLVTRRAEYGDERDPATRAFLTRISPVHLAGKIRVPLFIMHGGKDTRVPPAQAQAMAAAVRKNGVPVWLAVYADEGHIAFANSANNDFNLLAWAKFVQQYLLK